jgi:hypothetical protein
MLARAVFVLCLSAGLAQSVVGQDLAERFKQARIRRVATEMASRHGLGMNPRPPHHHATRGDSLAAWMASRRPDYGQDLNPEEPPLPPPFEIFNIRVVRKLERPVFLSEYGQTRWAFMQGRRRAEIDTTLTTDIRARLQARFGPPTVTLAEMDSVQGRSAEEIIQFEYWLVVNDSIPIMMLDVDGPLERGVVVSTDARFRDELDGVRYALLHPLFAEPRRAPYIDYFYHPAAANWYVSGFDGATFFHQRIARPNLALGRPVLSKYVSPTVDR